MGPPQIMIGNQYQMLRFETLFPGAHYPSPYSIFGPFLPRILSTLPIRPLLFTLLLPGAPDQEQGDTHDHSQEEKRCADREGYNLELLFHQDKNY